MIIVISDDFTGGAEIAGLGLRYGLHVVFLTGEPSREDLLNGTDLLIIATDTRSMSHEEAWKTTVNIKKKLQQIPYKWLYKKTDSVFRGHILAELEALLYVNRKNKALLVASNPPLGRKIIDGKYYIGDKLLHETEFARDPDFSIRTSDVIRLLGKSKKTPTLLLKPDEPLSEKGIYIGEAGTLGDLHRFAEKVNDQVLPAGGAGFFESLLIKEGYKTVYSKHPEPSMKDKKYLIVSGSANPEGKLTPEEAGKEKTTVSLMPDDIFYDRPTAQAAMKNWIKEIISLFQHNQKVVIEITQPVIMDKNISKRLKKQIVQVAVAVLEHVKVDELMIDGGATAYALVSALNFKKFYPVMEVAPGIIRMKVAEDQNFCITLKPGSYKWPHDLLSNQNKEYHDYI